MPLESGIPAFTMVIVAAIPILPVLAFVITVLMPRKVRNASCAIPLIAITGSVLCAFFVFILIMQHQLNGEEVLASGSWALAYLGGEPLSISLRADVIAAVLSVVVCCVSWCVQVFSLWYMHDDERKGWFFTVVSLFTGAMLSFVLAGDLLLAFVAWELMGLCSYFLIGFWFENDEPKAASQKAFIVTRVGDLGFLFALAVIYRACGTFDMATVCESVYSWAPSAAVACAIGLLLAACGKSAQVPLHVWLPDAMAGPTPASALIHAATMVAAGVLLVARTMPVFLAAPQVLIAVFIVGILTAFIGAGIACAQTDIKKVLAYSTISQLGLMFSVLGIAGTSAALFHLLTHAFFKAMLFLGSASLIHAVNSQDMRDMGGLRKKLPVTWITFLIGTLALAGCPPLSGFFSKDEIISTFLSSDTMAWGAILIILASVLTAFYMTRLYFMVFEGEPPSEVHKEKGLTMMAPLILLALVTVCVGWCSPAFFQLLGDHGQWPSLMLIITSICVVLVGFGCGWWIYGRGHQKTPAMRESIRKSFVGRSLANKLYFDTFYERFIICPFKAAAQALAAFDHSIIDGIVNGFAKAAEYASGVCRNIQNGQLQNYQRVSISAIIVLVACALALSYAIGA